LRESLPEYEIAARIEAALYSAGRPLSLEDLIRASGTNSKEKTQTIIKDLTRKTNSTFRAIEIAQLEDQRYVFQLRPQYTPLVRKFAQHPLIPSAALKTLSYIAYEQPVTSKRLVQIRGSQVYSHIKILEQLQFVEHEKVGRLKVYQTTTKFQSYFGITDLNTIKSKLAGAATAAVTTKAKASIKNKRHTPASSPRPPTTPPVRLSTERRAAGAATVSSASSEDHSQSSEKT
jgi:segregation and condensation protein B